MDHPRGAAAAAALERAGAGTGAARRGDDAGEARGGGHAPAADGGATPNPRAQPGGGSDGAILDERNTMAALLVKLRTQGGSDADVAFECLASLCDLKMLHPLDNADAIRAVLLAMQSHAGCADVQVVGCLLLADFTEHNEFNRMTAGGAGAIDTVAAAICVHIGHADVQRLGCRMLQRTVKTNASNARVAGTAGAAESIVAGMVAHAHVADVQECACSALSVLMHSDETGENMRRTGACGGIAAVVAALRAHGAEVRVQSAGSAALTHLTTCEEYLMQAVHAGAAEVLLASLRTHVADAYAISCVLKALHFVCHDGAAALTSARGAALPADITRAIVMAVDAHPNAAAVQCDGCSALARLLRGATNELQASAARCGAFQSVLRALREFRTSEDVQCTGCMALTALLCGKSDKRNHAAAVEGGAIAAAVEAMRSFPASTKLQKHAVDVLNGILSTVIDADVQTAVVNAGAVGAVVHALLAHPEDIMLQQTGCDTLYFSVSQDARHIRAAIAAGAIDAVVGALPAMSSPLFRDHQDAMHQFHESVCAVLNTLIRGDDARALAATRAGALEALRAHPPCLESNAFTWGDEPAYNLLLPRLRDAAARHDAAPCAFAACKRCGARRARGAMCARPGCGARKRAGGASSGEAEEEEEEKAMKRCGACAVIAYCCPAHQREDWERHKPECRELRRAAAAAAEAQQ
jgi:hypothetical protein